MAAATADDLARVDLARDVLAACQRYVALPCVTAGPHGTVTVHPAPGEAVNTLRAVRRVGLTVQLRPVHGTWPQIAVSR